MVILGIETSCDETALCILEVKGHGENFEYKIRGNIVHSQIELHKEYGGIYPALAKREHIKNLPILFEQIKKEAGITEKEIEAIAVTEGPGLEPALWTGIAFAEELKKLHGIPLFPINHMEGHIVSTLLSDSKPHLEFRKLKPFALPALAVLLSGGHTEIVDIQALGAYKVIGRTRDDAVGEAFDKVARMLGFSYPGGPQISVLAEQTRNENLPKTITLPRPMIHSKDLNFSFAGLKTAVLYLLQNTPVITDEIKKEISREFEDAVTEVIISKTKEALEAAEYGTLVIGGGVIANKHIREAFEKLASHFTIPLYLPVSGLSGDNALMIALAGALTATNPASKTKGPSGIKARGNLSLES